MLAVFVIDTNCYSVLLNPVFLLLITEVNNDILRPFGKYFNLIPDITI